MFPIIVHEGYFGTFPTLQLEWARWQHCRNWCRIRMARLWNGQPQSGVETTHRHWWADHSDQGNWCCYQGQFQCLERSQRMEDDSGTVCPEFLANRGIALTESLVSVKKTRMVSTKLFRSSLSMDRLSKLAKTNLSRSEQISWTFWYVTHVPHCTPASFALLIHFH